MPACLLSEFWWTALSDTFLEPSAVPCCFYLADSLGMFFIKRWSFSEAGIYILRSHDTLIVHSWTHSSNNVTSGGTDCCSELHQN